MEFEFLKKSTLDKLSSIDKSKKGSVDEFLIPLIQKINASKDFFTTSSCSGRINIFTMIDKEKKNTANWIFVSHDVVSFEEIWNSLNNLPSTLVMFKQEPFILHVCCRDLDCAQKILDLCGEIGIKHSSILTIKNKIVVKINGSEKIDAPIGINGKLIVDEEYIQSVLDMANSNLIKTHEKIKKLEESFNKLECLQ
ncbi:MAG: tRNA wybutosine-synthesizing 3 family protein [Candidatus Nanoarchaeia archaeon]|nr:tRNA wybutosine-synthesizing 3 family protein [Candidatus Nanoarchaeia archaeon]